MDEIDVIQPALLSIEIALAALWRSWGVEPDAVVGHSMGEVAAAYIAEALSLEDAMRIICTRSRLLRRVSGKGAMAVVGLPMDQAQDALAGFEDRVSVAVSNSPRSTVLSGDTAAMDTILDRLQARDVFCRRVKVDVASHSPQVDCLTDDLLRSLDGIQPREAKIPIYSTVTAGRLEGSALDARYWVNNLRCPVLFSKTLQRLVEDKHTIFIELSPHPVLLPSMEETVHHLGAVVTAVPSLEREKDEEASLLGSLGRLYTIGYPVNWKRLFPVPGKVVSLPAYPWQRQHFWLDIKPAQASQPAGAPQVVRSIRCWVCACRTWRVCRGSSFGRTDFRTRHSGTSVPRCRRMPILRWLPRQPRQSSVKSCAGFPIWCRASLCFCLTAPKRRCSSS